MSSAFFDTEFEVGTRTKLDLYRAYLRSWIPVFVSKMSVRNSEVHIYDLFSGPGTDSEGNKGSPLIAIDCIKEYENLIIKNNYSVILHLRDQDKESIKKLREIISKTEIPSYIKINIEQDAFPSSFKKIDKLEIKYKPTLFFLDQFGVKAITPDILNEIASLKRADALIFIASDFVKRFHKTDEIKKSFQFCLDDIEKTPKNKIHRKICEIFNHSINGDLEFHLSPFSIKKSNHNIYGIIHGSGHPLGIEKFLKECWKLDELTGEANFDIDDEEKFQIHMPLFEEFSKPTKIRAFESELEEFIKSKEIVSDKEIYLFSIRRGFIPTKHAGPVVKELIRDKILEFQGRQLRLSNTCLKDPRLASIRKH